MQHKDISDAIRHLDEELMNIGVEDCCIHTGPIIRKEENYKYMSVKERRRIFNKMVTFIKDVDISYKCFSVEKKHMTGKIEAEKKLARVISDFLQLHYEWFLSFDSIKVYYDNGQIELNRVLSSVFNGLFNHVEFRKVLPKDYKLFQAADLFCTYELLQRKLNDGGLSQSEMKFFGNPRDLKRNYIRHLQKKEFK